MSTDDETNRIVRPGSPVPDQHCGLYVAAFLDILGHRDRLRKIDALRATPQNCKELIAIAREVALLRNDMRGYFDRVPEISRTLFDQAPDTAREDGLVPGPDRVRIQAFADSLLITVAIVGSRFGAVPAADSWSVLGASCQAMLMALARGYAVRGGVDIGLCVVLPEGGERYGVAPLNAYSLERNGADYPRIVIGDGFMRYITEVAAQSGASAAPRMARNAAELVRSLVCSDDDGLFTLDYLSSAYLDGLPPERRADLIARAQRFVQEQAERWSSNAKIGPRYERLQNYFSSRL